MAATRVSHFHCTLPRAVRHSRLTLRGEQERSALCAEPSPFSRCGEVKTSRARDLAIRCSFISPVARTPRPCGTSEIDGRTDEASVLQQPGKSALFDHYLIPKLTAASFNRFSRFLSAEDSLERSPFIIRGSSSRAAQSSACLAG